MGPGDTDSPPRVLAGPGRRNLSVVPAGDVCALGIDPGPHTGMCLAGWHVGEALPFLAYAFECDATSAAQLLAMILRSWGHVTRAIQIEEFRQGRKSVQLRGVRAAPVQDEIRLLEGYAFNYDIPVIRRPAAMVKPWADDLRLGKAGMAEPTARYGHARDAARHALYCAVRDLGMPDPLSAEVH